MKRLLTLIFTACMAGALFSGSAQAAMITSSAPLGPATVIDFQQFPGVIQTNTVMPPVQVGTPVGEDVELFGLGVPTTSVGPINYNLGTNGIWDSITDVNFRSAYLPTSVSLAMEFVFNTGPVRGVGGFMNYARGFTPIVLIEAFDAGGVLLESHDLVAAAPIITPGGVNQGDFRGILRATSDISVLRITGNFVVLDDLTFTRVPEPASVLVLTLGGLGLLTRTRRKYS